MTEEQVVREVFRAYAQRDRGAIEALVAPDFLFVSPLDHEIDRDKYFCAGPTARRFSRLT